MAPSRFFFYYCGLPFGHPFGYLSFLYAFILFGSKKTKIPRCHLGQGFFSLIYSKCRLLWVGVYFHLRTFFKHSLHCFLWYERSNCSSFVYLKEESFLYLEEHSEDAYQVPMLVIKGEPADHDTQTCRVGPMLIYVSICHFSCAVYCGYTSPRGSLLSACLTHTCDREQLFLFSLRVLRTSACCWSFTEVGMRASFLRSGWFRFSHWFPLPPVPSPASCGPFQAQQLQLV